MKMPPPKIMPTIILCVIWRPNIPWRSEVVEVLIRAIVADAAQINARTVVVNIAEYRAAFFIRAGSAPLFTNHPPMKKPAGKASATLKTGTPMKKPNIPKE